MIFTRTLIAYLTCFLAIFLYNIYLTFSEGKCNAKSENFFKPSSEPDDDDADEPSDYEIWLSIKNSLDNWRNRELFLTNESLLSRKRRNEESVCYDHIGCFRSKGAFDYLNTLPASPDSIATTFTLYTRNNPLNGEILDYENLILSNNSTFNSTNDVKIIIHGFGSSSKRPWVIKMTETLLGLDDFNVINVDWQNGSKLPNYVQAVANTQLIGKQLAKLIQLIEHIYHMSPSRFHLIGFSLGAHVAGFAGQAVPNISRITGLDPASPLFEGYPPNVRLDPTDAQFVDVIHSNGDGFMRGGLGSYEPMGSVDFYPNGGRVQVGCSSALGVLTNILYYGQWNLLCNHRRAFHFFIDSVHSDCTFRAFSCTSHEEYIKGQCFECGLDGRKCSNMGYYSNLSSGRGQMFLVTRDKEPFCVNQFRIQINFSREQDVTWGQIELQLINKEGYNETFILTQETDQLKEGKQIQSLIVAHPKLTNITEVILTYNKYKGWLHIGKNQWNIDRIELLDSNFNIQTYCRLGTTLINSVPIRLKLVPTNCTIDINFYDNDNSIINAIVPDLISPITDATQASIITSETPITTASSNYHSPQYTGQFYTYLVPNIENLPHIQTYLPGEVSDYEPASTTIEPQLLKSVPLLHLQERPELSNNYYNEELKYKTSLLNDVFVNDINHMPISTLQQIESRQNGERIIKKQAKQSNLNTKENINLMPANIEDYRHVTITSIPVSNYQSFDSEQSSQAGLIAPIINGASKIFWKFWNNFNAETGVENNSSKTNSLTSSKSLVMETIELRPILNLIYPKDQAKVEKIVVLADRSNYEQARINGKNSKMDDIGGNEKKKDSVHYVLYSIIPFNSRYSLIRSLLPAQLNSFSRIISDETNSS